MTFAGDSFRAFTIAISLPQKAMMTCKYVSVSIQKCEIYCAYLTQIQHIRQSQKIPFQLLGESKREKEAKGLAAGLMKHLHVTRTAYLALPLKKYMKGCRDRWSSSSFVWQFLLVLTEGLNGNAKQQQGESSTHSLLVTCLFSLTFPSYGGASHHQSAPQGTFMAKGFSFKCRNSACEHPFH